MSAKSIGSRAVFTEREEFASILTAETDELTARNLGPFLMKQARILSKLHEAACNYGLTEQQEKRLERIEGRVVEVVTQDGAWAHRGMSVEFNSDPRGGSIYLKVASGRTNDMGQRGIYVPC